MPDRRDVVIIDVPSDSDAHALGVMHLLSWQETYVSAEHEVDAAWIDERMGTKTSPAAAAFRRRLFAAQRADPTRTFYRVVRERDEVVGFVHASRPPDVEGSAAGQGLVDVVAVHRESTLEALYLLREHQGTGIADRLMTAALEWLGSQPMRLEVGAYNARAVAFYERHGFELTGETALFQDRIPVVAMRRAALPAPGRQR